MAGKAKRVASGPRFDESVDPVPDSLTEPAKPTIDDLAQVGYQLDELVPTSASALARDPAADIAEQIDAAIKVEPDAENELTAIACSLSRHADTRMAIARILASHAISRQRTICGKQSKSASGRCTGWSRACEAFDKFSAAGMLDESARDIVATAILMPKAKFKQKSSDLGGDIGKLAVDFMVPIGAVALRRRILQFAPE